MHTPEHWKGKDKMRNMEGIEAGKNGKLYGAKWRGGGTEKAMARTRLTDSMTL